MSNYISKTTVNATTYALRDERISDAAPIRDSGAPLTTTKGTIGQIYIDESNTSESNAVVYICLGQNNLGYIWRLLSHSAPINAE